MSCYFRQKGSKTRYWFLRPECLGDKCFAPGMFQHRAPLMGGGSRNTGSPDSPCCMNNAYHGCPREDQRGESAELKKKRKSEGWKVA